MGRSPRTRPGPTAGRFTPAAKRPPPLPPTDPLLLASKNSSRILPYTSATVYERPEFAGIEYSAYRSRLRRLRVQLLHMQEWIKDQGLRVAVVLEGRDAAGKGSTAATMTRYLDPRNYRVIAQGVPSARQMRNWLGTYYRLLPGGGQMTFFDRSWYSRALVQPAMGYCTMRQYNYFMNNVNAWEEKAVDEGVVFFKIYLSVSRESQDLRFQLRQHSDLKYWKYSANDRRVAERWHMFTYFKERMFAVTSTDYAPWWVIDSDNKHQARLNAIHCLLSGFDYPDRDLGSTLPRSPDQHRPRNMIVDGVLFENMSPEQVQILEQIHMHE